MKTKIFDPVDQSSIIRFVSKFKLSYDTNSIHKGATRSNLYFFWEKPASAVLNSCIALSSKSNHCKEK